MTARSFSDFATVKKMLILSGPGDTNADDDSYFIMFLIRRNGICLPDECS